MIIGTTRIVRRSQPKEVYLVTCEIKQHPDILVHGPKLPEYGGRRWDWEKKIWEKGELFIGRDFIAVED